MILDEAQREEALDPARSFIVEAPAGSGKTGLLIQRYQRLLSVVEGPESIVAMTFTRKASGEIKRRVYEALEQAKNGAPISGHYENRVRSLAQSVLERDREQRWNLLGDPSRLQIQTIDALCAMLTRQMPVVSRFGGFAQVIEAPTELYHLAARRALSNLASDDEKGRAVFRRISLHFDNDMSRLEGQVSRMLERREQWQHLSIGSDHESVADFCHLLKTSETVLEQVFQERGQVDFTKVTRAAIRALGPRRSRPICSIRSIIESSICSSMSFRIPLARSTNS